MKPADEIENFVKKMSFKAGPEMDKDLWAETSKARNEFHKTILAPSQHNIWRTIMKSPITKLATAAIVIIACVTGVLVFEKTSSIALADVLAQIEKVKAFRCKGSLTMNVQIAPGKPIQMEHRYTMVISQDYGYKGNVEARGPNGGWVPLGERYFYPEKKTVVQIGHPIKTYFRWELDDAEAQQDQESLGQYVDPGALLRDIMACKYENLGRSTIDGIDVEGFRTTDPNCHSSLSRSLFKDPHAELDVKVWVDVKTRLPVRCEDLGSGLIERGNPAIAQSIVTDFEWDIPVTSSEFEPPPIPDGYTVVNKRPEPTDEEAAIQGLRQCVELFGNYIEKIGDSIDVTATILLAIEKSETPAALQLKKKVKELTEDEKLDRAMSAGWPFRRLIWFYVRLVQDRKDPAYYGKTVTPKDSDKALMRWKVSDNEYRVIYGDLHAENVTKEKLAELEKALPK